MVAVFLLGLVEQPFYPRIPPAFSFPTVLYRNLEEAPVLKARNVVGFKIVDDFSLRPQRRDLLSYEPFHQLPIHSCQRRQPADNDLLCGYIMAISKENGATVEQFACLAANLAIDR